MEKSDIDVASDAIVRVITNGNENELLQLSYILNTAIMSIRYRYIEMHRTKRIITTKT